MSYLTNLTQLLDHPDVLVGKGSYGSFVYVFTAHEKLFCEVRIGLSVIEVRMWANEALYKSRKKSFRLGHHYYIRNNGINSYFIRNEPMNIFNVDFYKNKVSTLDHLGESVIKYKQRCMTHRIFKNTMEKFRLQEVALNPEYFSFVSHCLDRIETMLYISQNNT